VKLRVLFFELFSLFDILIETKESLKIKLSMEYFKKLLLLSLCLMQIFAAKATSSLTQFAATVTTIAAGLAATKRFAQPEKPISNSPEYTVNLMWINKTLTPNQRHIFPEKNHFGQDIQESHMQHIITWAEMNPESTIHLWYDSAHTTNEACLHTAAEIKKRTDRVIILKDVREIPDVQKHARVFSDQTPVYFRADLLRLMACMHTLSTQKEESFVYADLDVTPMPKNELFDPETVQNLKDHGIILARYNKNSMENSFQITSKQNANAMLAIQRFLIERNIQNAEKNLRNGHIINPEEVFLKFNDAFKYLRFLQKSGYLTCVRIKNGELNEEPYNYNEHGFACDSLDDNQAPWNQPYYPTKKISAPPIKGYYN